MEIARRRELQRIALSVLAALLLHAIIFLLVEWGGFVRADEGTEYLGPVHIRLAEVTSLPDVAQIEGPRSDSVPSPATKIESETVLPPVLPDTGVDHAQIQPRTDPLLTGSATASNGVKPVQPEPQEEAPLNRSASQSKTAPEVVNESEYVGQDAGNTFSVKMGNISDRARPALKIPVQLPDWVREQNKKLEITLSFIVGLDGMVTHLSIDKSSGYPDVDRAVSLAVREWKFSNPLRVDRIMGQLTYRINQ